MKHAVDHKEMSKAEASFEIRKIVALQNKERRARVNDPITERQKVFLERMGIQTDGMTKRGAMWMIEKIKDGQRVGAINGTH